MIVWHHSERLKYSIRELMIRAACCRPANSLLFYTIAAFRNLLLNPTTGPPTWPASPRGGLIQNRTKDGGFYRVRAIVIPVIENDGVIGYASVGSNPAAVAAAPTAASQR
jgi:hypothetical protein